MWLPCAAIWTSLCACAFHPGVLQSELDASSPTVDTSLAADGSTTADAAAGALLLRSIADAWLRQQFPTENHGADADLRSGSGSTTSRANRIVISFDVSGLPATCQLSAARLYLYYYAEDFVSISPTLEAHRITAPWIEGTTTWSTWGSPGGDFDLSIESSVIAMAATFGWLSWDVTTLAGQWRAGTVPNYGVIILENDNTNYGGRKLFYSAQSSTTPTDLRPYLQIECT